MKDHTKLSCPEKQLATTFLGTFLFQSFAMSYLELSLEHSAISNCFSLPLAQINPSYLELDYVPKKHWSTSVGKCSQGTSWQDVLKAEKCIDMFTLMKAKVRLTGLTAANAGDKLPLFVVVRVKLLLQKCDANLTILNPHYLELFLDTLESLRCGFSCIYISFCHDLCLLYLLDATQHALANHWSQWLWQELPVPPPGWLVACVQWLHGQAVTGAHVLYSTEVLHTPTQSA